MVEPRHKNSSHWPLVVLSMVPAMLGVLLPLIIVRILSPTEVGTFKIFFLYLGIAPAVFLTSGIRSGLPFWAGQESKRTEAMEVSSTLLLVIALVAALLTLALTTPISAVLSVSPFEVRLFALSLFGAIAGCFFEEAAIAVGRIWTGAIFYCGSEILRTIAIVGALSHSRTITSLLLAHTAISGIKVIVGYSYGYHLGLVKLTLSPSIVKDVLRYAMPVSLAYAFGIFIGSADQLMLANRITQSEFALYSIGCLSVAPLFIFEQSITRVLIPQMSEALSKQETRRAAMLYQSAVDNLAFLLIPAVTGLIVFAKPIIELLFTKQYSDAATYLRIFGLSYLLLIIPHDALARSQGDARWILRTFMIFAGLSLVLCSALIYTAGPVGALVAVLLSGSCMRLCSINHFTNKLAIKRKDFIPVKGCLAYVGLCLVLGSAALLVAPHFHNERSWMLGAGSLFLVSYLGLALPIKNRAERRRSGPANVLLLTQSLHVGGLERMILHLSRSLQSHNTWRVRVLAYDHEDTREALLDSFRQAAIPVEAFKKGGGFSFRVVGRILKTIYQHDISIIHSHDLGTLMYAVVAKLLSFGRISIVHTQHSFPSYEGDLRHRVYRRICSKWIDQLGVVSEDVQAHYSRLGIKREHIHLIENGVDFAPEPILDRAEKITLREELLRSLSPDLRGKLNPFLNDLWIIYQARFSPGKGQEHALQIWREMSPQERQHAILCLVGPESKAGEYDRIRSLIEECPDQGRILILGANNAPLKWLRASDVFLSCSEYEGMPLAPLEAAGSGLPLLLSRIPGHTFLGEVGLQFSLDDSQQGARQLENLLNRVRTGKERYQRELWENSRHIRDRFSVSRMSARYSSLYSMASS